MYWEGSKHYPGDKYTVTEDHTFTAVWAPNDEGTDHEDGEEASPGSGTATRANAGTTARTRGRIARTGDMINVVPIVVVLCVAAVVLVATGVMRRRRG